MYRYVLFYVFLHCSYKYVSSFRVYFIRAYLSTDESTNGNAVSSSEPRGEAAVYVRSFALLRHGFHVVQPYSRFDFSQEL